MFTLVARGSVLCVTVYIILCVCTAHLNHLLFYGAIEIIDVLLLLLLLFMCFFAF